jgi:hypothetical protein
MAPFPFVVPFVNFELVPLASVTSLDLASVELPELGSVTRDCLLVEGPEEEIITDMKCGELSIIQVHNVLHTYEMTNYFTEQNEP